MFDAIEDGISTHIIFEPLFYRRFIRHSFEYYRENKTSLGKIDVPKYIVCVFSSPKMVKDWISLLPTFKVIPLFVTPWDEGIASYLAPCFEGSEKKFCEELKIHAKVRVDREIKKRNEKKK